MSNHRTRPTRKGWHYDGSPAVLDPHGRKTCRWCRGSVVPPRRSFCGEPCVHEWRLRTDPGYLRDLVFRRDRGVCALCGLDTEAAIWEARATTRESPRSRWGQQAIRAHLKSRGIVVHPHRISLWDADHITPVSLGGGECDIDNLRTLCLMCHGAVTRHLARQRAGKRTQEVPRA